MNKIKKIFTDKRFIITTLFIFIAVIIAWFGRTYSSYSTVDILEQQNNRTGINENMVIIDDYLTDYNYYMGRNFTESSDGSIPTGINQNLYNDNNLVQVDITYSGIDINDNTLIGYVSDTERQNTYIYYKYYPVQNGYITIELIDNPFTDRPNNKGFNGWVTNYEGATISYDNTYYKRYAKVPVNGSKVEITFNASWTDAHVLAKTSNNNWQTVFSSLSTKTMEQINGQTVNVYEDVTQFYTYDYIYRNDIFPDNSVNSYGDDISGTSCNSYYCTYYTRVLENVYAPNTTYYALNNGRMQRHTIEIIGTEVVPSFDAGTKLAGYFKKVTINYNASANGYYDESGILQKNTTCRTRGGCTYYELIQYYDENGNVNVSDNSSVCYRLITRDLNIVVLTGNISNSWSSSQNKPFTFTAKYNDQDYTNYYWDVSRISVNCYNDTRIENMAIYSNDSSNSTTPSGSTDRSGYLYGNYNNVKIGRGITSLSSSKNFDVIVGGDNSSSALGSSNNVTKYHLNVESGFYNTITLSNGQPSSWNNVNNNKYLEAKATYGNDYDKANRNNNLMDVYFDVSSSFGLGNYYASSDNSPAFDTTVKSGRYGSQAGNDHTAGIYVGGRGYGTHTALRQIKVEGGWIYNLIGGPLTATSRENLNDTYIEMTGGVVDVIIGGAGTSATYGNRIVSVTGGIVNYSVFGGSNGYDGDEGDGTLNGDSFVYVGGNTTIGNADLIANSQTKWGAESGSVFGIGNGNSSVPSIGSNDNSNIIVDNKAHILNNVYGGGNFGATGISSTSNTNITNIYIKGGTVEGSVYGGGNNNGSGSSTKASTINIEMTEGTINGSIYGGSKTKGVINGNVNVNILGGQINTSVYGGGEGGYKNSSDSGTFVTGSVNVIVGSTNENNSSPIISNSVYGGSAFGTVNSNTETNVVSTTNTSVTINSGTIQNVYGGGEGDSTYTPYVCGNVTVNINGGIIENAFGANDLKGTPNGTVTLNVNGGTVTNAYAGGNQTEVSSPYINLLGGTVTNAFGGGNNAAVTTSNVLVDGATITNVFGGSNASGDVVTSNVLVNSGMVENTFGGNNVGGTTATTNVTINGGNTTNIYGGGEQTSVTMVANVNINTNTTNVFGGSDSNGTVQNTIVNINSGGSATNVYGGNNLGGTAINTNVNVLSGGTATDTYGGGLRAVTNNTNVTISNNGTSQNVYGGGNEGDVAGSTTITITNGSATNVYGGGNNANVNNDTNATITNGNISSNIYGGGNNGMVLHNANVTIANSQIGGSAYAGGNGSTATVIGNNKINVEGTTNITNHLFGGGNAAATGCSTDIVNDNNEVVYICSNPNTSQSEVNVAGATIGGNVYGGANTSVVYGTTNVNIGTNTINEELTNGNIEINGTVFGGGEANASGSEDYDFNFISVTEGININIDASDHNIFNINGSIFGSGNASSSGGYSYIDIKNYGTIDNPKHNISVQRTDIITLDNSSVLLDGAQDRTNKYKSELFTLSRIGELKLKNGSTIYLKKGANLLENFSSLVDVDGSETLATVTIVPDTNIVTKNVDNRVYMYEGKNLNISDDESLATFGNVNGMSFFGMFKLDRNGNVATGLYSHNYTGGDLVSGSDLYYFTSGSYVVGKHKSAHNIYTDGFYSNYANEEGTGITTKYIDPTPDNAPYYRWVIGEAVEILEVNITASKYSTLGTNELQLLDYYAPNTEIYILGVNFDELERDINLLPSDDIPRFASNTSDANTNFGLGMKTGNTGWITKGGTEFSTNESSITGTTYYKAENSNAIPSFIFYLYHSKNISETKQLGTVMISLMVVTPIDDLSNTIKRINIEVNMNSAFYDGDNYEASIAPGNHYEMFANSNVNITNKSTFSAYFSLYSSSETSIYKPGYKRSLVSSYAYPENTKITMIDLASSGEPEYYYYIIDNTTYNNSVISLANDGEVSYPISNFIRMDSPSKTNTYNDAEANSRYYDSTLEKAEEEFIFIVDLKNAGIDTDVLNKTLLLELRDSNNNPVIPVLDISQQKMFYNLYNNKDGTLALAADLSNNTFYIGQRTDLHARVNFSQQTLNNITIIDTNYYDNRLGIKLSMYDSDGEIVNGADLLGTAFIYNGVKYYPRQDGTVRFSIAETVANVSSRIIIDLEKSNISSGNYTLSVEAFASPNGIYSGINQTFRIDKNITVVNEAYGLDAILQDNDAIIDKNSGLSADENKFINFQVLYESGLTNPNIRVSMYRRTYTEIYNYTYTLVDLQDYVTDELITTNEEKIYMAKILPTRSFQFILNMKENLITGTYQIRFNLYDGDNYVGHINKYIIIE